MNSPEHESTEHFYQAIRESCHTLNNKLIAVQGFCELMVQDEATAATRERVESIRKIAIDISHITHAISACIKSQAQNPQDAETVSTGIQNDVCKLKSVVPTLRAEVEQLLQQAHCDNDKAASYQQKALVAMQQVEAVIAQITQ
ncbi:MAG: hypothetical protein P1U32_08450 [Legionellaceae bacterium]|nr:hypothetical protein [Legionellaceae bacterium]